MRAISIGFLLALTAVAQAQNDHKVLNSEQTATLCTLLNHPSEYSGKTVRLQAIVASGLEFSVLRDDSCPAKENPTSGKHDVVLATFGKDVHDVPWGTGKGDPKGMMEELKRQGYKGYLSIEYEYGSLKDLAVTVPKCIAFFDKTAAELVK